MSNKTNLQLETELKAAQAQIAHLEDALNKVQQKLSSQIEVDERLHQLLNILPIGISALDAERKVRFQNSALSQILELNAQELEGGVYKNRTYLSADGSIMPNDRLASARAIKTGQPVYDIETGIVKEDGKTIWANVSAMPVNFADWKTIVVTSNITERKLAERQLSESRELFQALFNLSPVAYSLAREADNKIVNVNPACERLFGYSKDEVVGMCVNDIDFWVDQNERQKATGQFIQNGELRDFEFAYRTRTGTMGWAIAYANLVEQGGEKYVLAEFVDITKRKHAEQELTHQAEILREQAGLLEHAHVLIRDLDNRIVLWTEGMEKLYGWTKEEALGQITHTFFQTIFPISFEAYQAELMQSGHWEGELTHTCKDGTKITVSSHHVLYRDPSGKPYLILAVSNDITARKHAEEDLRQSRENFARAFNSNPAALAITQRDTGKFMIINESYTKVMGYESCEVLNRTVTELNIYINPDERANLLKQLDKDGRLRNYELWVRAKSGEVRGLMVSMEPIQYDDKPCILSTFLDITERKRMERQLTESERSYRELVQNANTAIIRWKTNGEIAFFNEYAQSFFGYTAEEVTGKPVNILIPQTDSSGSDLSRLVQSIADDPGRFEKMINENVCRDGRRVWMAWTNRPVYDADGLLTEVLAVGIDITDRKRAEDELRSSQRLLHDIIDNTPALVYILDKDGRFLLINRPLEKLLGLTTQQMFGRTRADFLSSELARQHQDHDQEIFNSGQGKIFEEETIQSDGRHVYLTTKFPLFDANGSVYAVCAISTDMTARKQMEEELRRSNAELEQFAYIASHDLQEPLRAVSGMVQLLQKRYQGQLDARADEYISHAVEAAGRMQALIQALLSYSRVERRKQPIEQVDAGKCLAAALKNLDVSIRESHTTVSADALPTVHADPVQLTQLFQNLIGNGIKFRGDKEPQIHISATKLKDAWQFSVRDNGIGIEPQYFERIFLIFQRLHTRSEYSGTGIGLALCKKIVERHGGRIWVESDSGQGSTFHFTLPMRSH